MNVDDLPLTGRLIAFDLGEVRIGVAVSDPGQIIASPMETLQVPRNDDRPLIDALVSAAERHEAEGIVLGHPRRLDGVDGSAAQRAKMVAAALRERTQLPVAMFDERFSTVEAERLLLDADLSRAERKGVVDRVAAAVILQSALDAQRRRHALTAPPVDTARNAS
ncbi:MAG: Holliday junction resolvase RuvX [Nitriliruptoraceae bacterium]